MTSLIVPRPSACASLMTSRRSSTKSFVPLALLEISLGLPFLGIACSLISLVRISKCGPANSPQKFIGGFASDVPALSVGSNRRSGLTAEVYEVIGVINLENLVGAYDGGICGVAIT